MGQILVFALNILSGRQKSDVVLIEFSFKGLIVKECFQITVQRKEFRIVLEALGKELAISKFKMKSLRENSLQILSGQPFCGKIRFDVQKVKIIGK